MNEQTRQLQTALDELSHCSVTIQGSEIVTKEGLTLLSKLPADTDEERAASMMAALLHLGHHAAMRVLHENIMEVLLRSRHGWLVAVPCGDKAVLIVITPSDSELAIVFREVEYAAAKIARMLA